MLPIDSINVLSPQSALFQEDRINIDTVINKPASNLSLEDENYRKKTDMTSSISVNTLDNDEEKEQIIYHYNYASAIQNLAPDEIGLVCFPIQKRLQAFKNGANFTIMCVGESGVGKTSFINTLFDSLLIELETNYPMNLLEPPQKTAKIIHHKMELVEDGFKLRLNVIDTPGFGDYIDNRFCWYPITKYIDEKYRRVVYQENQPDRSKMVNGEVHVCLYFIVPSATGLTHLDIEAMKNLSTRVNLVPIIAKADAFTANEISIFKERIRNTLKDENISICELIDQTSFAKTLINEMPFTIINSITRHQNEKGEMVRSRSYKWGLAEVENPDHCDFLKLRQFLIETNMGDLISSTESYYENYRKDFMKYRLGKSIQFTATVEDLEKMGVQNYDKEVIVPSSRGSWRSLNKENTQSHPNLDQLINTKGSIEVLNVLNRLSLKETEKELVELNPSYLELEKQVKKKFTGIVQAQNQTFKDWKRTLFEKQDKFNKDIEQVHSRVLLLQEEIKNMDYQLSAFK